MVFKKNFVRKLWWDSRQGHSTYLMFLLAFLNFILITFNYLIEGNSIFETFISNLWIFSIIFVILYLPTATLIGRWHTKTQLSVEESLKLEENPIMARMVRTLLDAKTGKASEEEITEFRKIVSEIEKKDIHEF
jgi:uncharacterized protein YneF (UPF0154 family)|tara:strand:+ start:414 stop:815 length:402 start_codon:yes stop_codon:yes gene_type:complete